MRRKDREVLDETKIDDVEPIMNHVYDPGVLVVKADSQFKTLADFVEYAKAHPDELTISNNGAGASNHIGAAHFAKEAKVLNWLSALTTNTPGS